MSTTATIKSKTGKDVGPYKSVPINECRPNDWNPNKMNAMTREKLTRGIKMVLDSAGHIPPIVVRPHPDPSKGKYQIIDGFHRWDIVRNEGHEHIDAYIINVDTKTAMLLTDTLNYLRGEPDHDGYVKYFQRLLVEGQTTPAEIAEYVPESADEIITMLENYDIHIDHIEVPGEGGDGVKDEDDDPFVEVKFMMSRSQQEVVERELARIGVFLQGKNIRGRALEFMAVNSSQTPIDNLMGQGEEPPAQPVKNTKKRKTA